MIKWTIAVTMLVSVVALSARAQVSYFYNTSSSIIYSGTWADSGQPGSDGYSYSTVKGDSATFSFNGTGVSYITETSANEGNVSIYIDGTYTATVNCHSPTPLANQSVYSTNWPAGGAHTIEIINAANARMSLNAFAVNYCFPPVVPKFSFRGKPFFPIALYNYAVAGGAHSQSVSSLKAMAAAGFNTLLQYDHDSAWENTPAMTANFLNTAQIYNIAIIDQLWSYTLTTNWIDLPAAQVPGSAFYNQINKIKNHPDLLAYETFDEAASYPGITLSGLQSGYNFVKSLDTNHMILFNSNPIWSSSDATAITNWTSIADTFSCDFYPVDPTSFSQPWPMSDVANNQDYNYQATATSNVPPFVPTKPIYVVMQGFQISNAPPTLVELQNMMYRTIIHGAAASLWWGTYQLAPTSPTWTNLELCAGELRDLEPVLENGFVLGVVRSDAAVNANYASINVVLGNPNLEAIAYWYVQPDGTIDNYVVVANTNATTTVTGAVAVGGWNSGRNGNNTRVLFETDTNGNQRPMIPSTGNSWSDTFAPWQAHVYTDRLLTSAAMDFDGDGVPDTAAYNPSSGEVQITRSSNGQTIYVETVAGGSAIAADVDGDGKADLCIENGGSYVVYLSTLNYTGTRRVSSVTGTVFSVPIAPTGLAATRSSNLVVLSWSMPAGATSYNLYWSNASGTEGSTPIVTNIVATSYTNAGLAYDSTNFFTIAAVNASGVSAQSGEVSVVVPPPTSVVQSLVATNGTVKLDFTIQAGGNYAVQRSTNLLNWVTLGATNTTDSGSFQWMDNFQNLGDPLPSAYYRLVYNR